MTRRILALTVFLVSLGAGALTNGPAAIGQETFYAGKTVTIIAGYPPGGGVDGELRVLARHISRFIPGTPTIVAKNMPGAGGIILANHLYNNIVADGLTLGLPGRSGFLLSNLVRREGTNFDLAKFEYIGGAGGTNSILWLRRETGVNSMADLSKGRELVLGAWSARSQNAIVPKILAKYRGWPFKVVHGYPGTSEVLIAVERGEIDGLYSHEGSIQTARPDLLKSGGIKPIFQTYKELQGVPILSDTVKDAKEGALLALLSAPSRIGLPFLAPPGTPRERVEILRAAHAQMVKDPSFQEEARKRGLPAGQAIAGADLQKLIAETLSSVAPDTLKEYMSYMEVKETKETK